GRVVDVAGIEPAEGRQMGGGHVDRPAPCVLDRHTGKRGEHEPESLGRLLDGARVPREHLVDGAAGASAPAAEGDPAVARRPEIAERRAEIADELAAGPADLLDSLRRRRGEHYVAAPCDHSPAE